MKKTLLLFALSFLLSSCGIQRPLVLPQNDKYKYKKPADSTSGSAPAATPAAPSTTSAPAPVTVAPNMAPSATPAPSNTNGQ